MSIVAELLIKVTVLLGAAALASAFLRGSSAAVRHAMWSAAVMGALALPLFVIAVPDLRVPVLPAPQRVAQDIPSNTALDVPAAPVAGSGIASQRDAALSPASSSIATLPDNHSIAFYGYLAWAIVSSLTIFRLAIGSIGLLRVKRRANELDADWQSILHQECTRIGVARQVMLATSRAVSTPVTFGIFNPTVLLPVGCDEWPEAQRRVVLRHELAHVVRRDALTQLTASLVCAMYWFHPAVWMASRRLRIERERACDDVVLTHGTAAPDYAAHLLDVARVASAREPFSFIAIAMARPSHFEGRLLAILDGSQRRGTAKIGAFRTLVTTTLCIGMLAAFQPVPLSRGIVQNADESRTANDAPAAGTTTASDALSEPPVSISSQDTVRRSKTVKGKVEGWITVEVAPNSAPVNFRFIPGDANTITVRSLNKQSDGLFAEGGGLALDTSMYGNISLRVASASTADLVVSLPSRHHITVGRSRGSVAISNLEGMFTGELIAGGYTLDGLRGSVKLKTDSGNISVRNSNLDGFVETHRGTGVATGTRGRLRVLANDPNVGKGVVGSTLVDVLADQRDDSDDRKWDTDGIIVTGTNIRVKESALRADRENELFITNDLPNGGWLTAHNDITVVSSSGPLYARTTQGRIRIHSTNGDTWAITGSGPVEITVKKGAGRSDIFVESGGGDVELVLPAQMGATFDLQTQYGPNDPAATIEGPAALVIAKSGDWENGPNGRRKIVRATGRVGAGEARIRVRTTSGKITVRQH